MGWVAIFSRAYRDIWPAFGGPEGVVLTVVSGTAGAAFGYAVDPSTGGTTAATSVAGLVVGLVFAVPVLFALQFARAPARIAADHQAALNAERSARRDAERRLATELDTKGQEELLHAIRSELANDLDGLVVEGSQLIRDIPAGKVRREDLDDALARWSLRVRSTLVRSYGIHNAWRPMNEVPGVFSTNPHEQARRVMEERHRRLLELVQRCDRGSANPLRPALLLPVAPNASLAEGDGGTAAQ